MKGRKGGEQEVEDFDPFSSSWDGRSANFVGEPQHQQQSSIQGASVKSRTKFSVPDGSWQQQMDAVHEASPLRFSADYALDDDSSKMWKPPNFSSGTTQTSTSISGRQVQRTTIPSPTKNPGPASISVVRKRVDVVIEEQLSVRFDDISTNPWCSVTGCIRVKPKENGSTSFCIAINDPRKNISRFERNEEACQNVTSSFSPDKLAAGDQIFRIHVRDKDLLESPIATYTCSSRLKPMPLLLRNKVQKAANQCRVILRIRANPGNEHPLTSTSIIMVVPPDVMGETVAMSRKGGLWNEMQRTISWTIPKLDPGENLEIQSQFECANVDNVITPKFPVLLRCDDTEGLFSGLELRAIPNHDSVEGANSVEMNLMHNSRLLYRKI